MEQNLPIIPKKFWKIVQVLYYMLRKGISKSKILADFSSLLKRGKIASKAAMHNLLFHVHGHVHDRHAAVYTDDFPQLSYPTPLNEYEFSCSNSPAAFPNFLIHFAKRGKRSHATPRLPGDAELFAAALEIAQSPAFPGFGRTPVTRQLRITDSPFPVAGDGRDEDNHVDEAAEEFIIKFYKDLRQQK